MIPMQEVKRKSKASSEQGIALLMCIFALLLLTGLALALMYMSDTEQAINNNYRDSERAYFAAMAGLQDARIQMRKNKASDPWPAWVPSTMPKTTANTGVTYITNPNNLGGVQPWLGNNGFMDHQLCNENFAAFVGVPSVGPNVPCLAVPNGGYSLERAVSKDPNRGAAGAMDYRWVRITRKSNRSSAPFYVAGSAAAVGLDVQMCWNGAKQLPLAGAAECELVNPNPEAMTTVYRLTSFAIAPGGTQRMLQMDVAENPPIMTNAAVDSQDHVTLNGQLDVFGYDFCTCDTSNMGACTKDPVTGITQCPGATLSDGTKATCDNSKWSIYSSNSVENPNPSEKLIAGPNPPYVENQPWPFNIPKMIESLKGTATDVTKPPYNWNCGAAASGTNGNCGTHSGGIYGTPPAFPPSPVDDPAADTSYGSCSGGIGPGCPNPQVTYVPGNVQLTGGSTGNGILIVDGDLDIHGGLSFYGLVLVRGVVKFTGGGSDKTNIYGAVIAGQESYVDNVLGGSAVIRFNSCALRNAQKPQPPTTISFHELPY